jgi:hypothetical protein
LSILRGEGVVGSLGRGNHDAAHCGDRANRKEKFAADEDIDYRFGILFFGLVALVAITGRRTLCKGLRRPANRES